MSQTATLILTHGQIQARDHRMPFEIDDLRSLGGKAHDPIVASGGNNFSNLELRWEGVPSLADALRMLKDQADRTPSPQWVRAPRIRCR
jgi:hypothetical protein